MSILALINLQIIIRFDSSITNITPCMGICSLWDCLWGNALKRSPGIILKSRVSYPGPGFLSSATWPSLPKKHFNGLNQTN